jgi:hypothetical protein
MGHGQNIWKNLKTSLKVLTASTLGFIVALAVNNAIMDAIRRDPEKARTPPYVIAISLFLIALFITVGLALLLPENSGSHIMIHVPEHLATEDHEILKKRVSKILDQ